jgi:hypothetical protein
MKLISVARLRVGQRFSFFPAQWFGSCKLISKTKREENSFEYHTRKCSFDLKREFVYDLKYDCACVNPPGVDYGLPASTFVRLLKPGKTLSWTKFLVCTTVK